jgi:hypothetical protein
VLVVPLEVWWTVEEVPLTAASVAGTGSANRRKSNE